METPGHPINEFMKHVDVEKMTSRAALLFFQFNSLLNQVTSIEDKMQQMGKQLDAIMYRLRMIEKT